VREPILYAAAPERGRELASVWRGQPARFACVLAGTDTCLLPGVSAAGATEELRLLTPAADAEAVHFGAPRCLHGLPSNPLGAPGPAAITRAALRLSGIEPTFVATGLHVSPRAPVRRVDGPPGGRIDRARAVPHARRLFEQGVPLGRELARGALYLVLGESVPGGTTTALAVLLALGIPAEGRVSGSQPGNAHALKTCITRTGLRAAGLAPGDGKAQPLEAIAEIGDPMQALATGMVLGAIQAGVDVLLAGGSQMLAVAAVLAALEGEGILERVAIGTTRWVAADPSADVAGLARDISPRLPVLAANLDFGRSRHVPLRAYERFLVKEGVGAGGACIATLLRTGVSIETLEAAIDAAYDEVLVS
jgi:uncharacterized protein (TIGR00303 family)